MCAAPTERNEQSVGDLALACGNEHRRVGDSLAADARLKVIGALLARDLEGGVAAFESAQTDRRAIDTRISKSMEVPEERNCSLPFSVCNFQPSCVASHPRRRRPVVCTAQEIVTCLIS